MFKNKISKINLIGIILLKICMDFCYTYFVVGYFRYQGYEEVINMSTIVEGWIWYLFTYFLLVRNKKMIIYPTLFFIFLLLVIPTITLFSYGGQDRNIFYIQMMAYNLFFLILSSRRKIAYRRIQYGGQIIITLSVFLTILVLLNYMATVKVPNFDLSKVYELRQEYGEVSNRSIFAYLNNWVTKILNAFLILWTLHRRKFRLLIVFLIIQILFFGYSGHKFTLFIPILIFIFYFLLRNKNGITYMIYGMLFSLLVLVTIPLYSDEIILPSILIRRAFFIPTFLNYKYIEFFTDNPFVFWSNGILKYLIDNPYGNVNMTKVIGAYLGEENMTANSGLIASGFMHAGIVGILMYMVIFSFLIKIIESIKLPKWFVNGLIMVPMATAFISSDLMTTLLTHGFLLCVVVLYLYSSANNEKKIK